MKKAFTLVEMLVVIGIISILMGASLAGFSKMKKSAEKAKCQELVYNTSTALQALFLKQGAWPKRLRENGKSDGRLDETAAYPLARGGFMSLALTSDNKSLTGLDKFGLVTPWASAVIKAKGSSASASTKVPTGGTVDDHRLHFALDLDGDGFVTGNVGGESVTIRANAMVWCSGADGKIEAYSKGLRKDDVYSWTKGQVTSGN